MPSDRRAPRRLTVVASATLCVALVLAASALASSRAGVLGATPVADSSAADSNTRWLSGLTAPHRQLFDAPAPNGGIPLVHVLNYYDSYNKAFGVKDADIDAVLTFYGATTFHALRDAAWEKYRLGEFLELNDPSTGKPATRNPWRSAPVVMGMTLPNASLESLHKRGATLIVCDNALTIFSGLLAAKRNLDAKAVYADLKASILPQVQLVPSMVVAVEQAARAGLTYHRE